MSHALKASTCLDSLLHLDSGRSMMLLSVLEWATILICPGLGCFLGCGTFSANTGSVLGKLGFSVTYLVLCTALWDEFMDTPPPPLRGTNSPLCVCPTHKNPCTEETQNTCLLKEWKKEWLSLAFRTGLSPTQGGGLARELGEWLHYSLVVLTFAKSLIHCSAVFSSVRRGRD